MRSVKPVSYTHLDVYKRQIQKVENNRFARADLEGKLLMVDDDLDMNALTKTNYVKSIVTAELRMDLERKKEQSYQGDVYKRQTSYLIFSCSKML